MFLLLFTAISLLNKLESKPVIVRNISDCGITADGILHYRGKHSFTRFEHECLPWIDLQAVHSEIINELNFFNDPSIKEAKNYCRNPNMNINGPWCFVQNEDIISMEVCNVCQSLASRPTLPTNIDTINDSTVVSVDTNFFQNIGNEIKRYGAYLRKKALELINRMKEKIKQLQTKFSNRFNLNE